MELAIFLSFIILCVIAIFYYFSIGTKFDRVKSKSAKDSKKTVLIENIEVKDEKQQNENSFKMNSDKKVVNTASSKTIDTIKKNGVENVKSNDNDYDNINQDENESLNQESISVNKEKDNSLTNEKPKNKTLKDEINNLSPQLKAILFTDIIKPKF